MIESYTVSRTMEHAVEAKQGGEREVEVVFE